MHTIERLRIGKKDGGYLDCDQRHDLAVFTLLCCLEQYPIKLPRELRELIWSFALFGIDGIAWGPDVIVDAASYDEEKIRFAIGSKWTDRRHMIDRREQINATVSTWVSRGALVRYSVVCYTKF